jgi:hypothetical protein
MATESMSAGALPPVPRLRLPERLPDLRQPWLRLFELIWIPALLLAIAGPVGGLWLRLNSPSENSALMHGSRAGLVLSDDDLTHVRFPVGQTALAAGVQPGDDIVAIDGIPLSKVVPLSPSSASQGTETDYALFGPLIQSGEPLDLDLTLRARDGKLREYRVRTGEQHIEQSAALLGLSPTLLGIIDLLHILTYPFLIFAAWILHRRRREDLNSSILSLAILLTIAAEQPSADFLTFVVHLPQVIHQAIYDLGNICLIAGVLLFPFGRLRPLPVVAFVTLLPLLFFLKGDSYRLTFFLFMAAGVATLVWRLRQAPPNAERQQIKWGLLGFSGYALFVAIALTSDMAKLQVGSFSTQLVLEIIGGLSFGLGFLLLQFGLLTALLRYRLYDAEVVISRSASFALITVMLGGVFAASNEAVKLFIQNLYGPDAGQSPGIFAAAVATVLVTPAQERISNWSERRFQRNLVKLRDELPECVRDMRETASLSELLDEVLGRIESGLRTVRTAVVIGEDVARVRDTTVEEVQKWLSNPDLGSCEGEVCYTGDKTFPIRVPLAPANDSTRRIGWILIGPRPDGSISGKEEQRTLAEIADPIARAVRNVMTREKRELELTRLIDGQRERIDSIELRLDTLLTGRSSQPKVN